MIADHERVTGEGTMVDEGSEPQETDDPDEERCAHCGSMIDVTSWHPLLSRTEDSEVHLYPFCNVNCRDAWLDD